MPTIEVQKPKILEKMKSREESNKFLICGKQPLLTMRWNGDFIIEIGVGQSANYIETGINIKDFKEAIDEIN